MIAPALSVIIPTYNRARSLGRAIESVLAQTFQNVETIVIDDGSQDDTVEVLSRFEGRIRLIRQENRGASAARNVGIRAAQGRWVAFLDSDDEWRPNKLALQIEALEKYSFRVCFTRCLTENGQPVQDIDELLRTRKGSDVHCFADAVDSISRLNMHPLVPSLVVEKAILEQAGSFDESLYVAEDTRLIYNLACLSGFIYLYTPVVVIHRGSHNSLTYDLKPEPAARRFSSYLRVQMEVYWRILEIRPEEAYLLRKRIGYFISRRAELACAANQLRLARYIAKDGLCFAGDLRTFTECLALWLCPGLFRGRFRAKWHGTGKT